MSVSQSTIVDRVVERIKASQIGDLIADEDLYDIVKEAFQKAFFEERKEPGRYAGDYTRKEPLMVEFVRSHMEAQARELVTRVFDEHKEQVAAYWKEVLDKGLMEYVQTLQSRKASTHIAQTLQPLLDQLNQERARHGLPMFFLKD